MKLVKMSLVTAVAVASLSTASLAETKISGKADFRWLSATTGDLSTNELTRERIDLHVKSASKDGMGKAHYALRSDMGELLTLRAYADYKLGSVTLGIGPKIGFPGNFSFGAVRGITVATKVAGFDIAVGTADKDTGMESDEKSIITAKGKVAIATVRFDYRLGADKNDYLATDAKVKVGPATITAGYIAGQGDNNKDTSIMGADVSVGIGSITAHGAFSMSGKNGGAITENVGFDGRAIGDISGSTGMGEVTAMEFGAKTTIDDVTIQAYYSMATPDGGDTSSTIYVDSKKNLNTQSSINIRYYIDSTGKTGDDDTSTIELRFASKF